MKDINDQAVNDSPLSADEAFGFIAELNQSAQLEQHRFDEKSSSDLSIDDLNLSLDALEDIAKLVNQDESDEKSDIETSQQSTFDFDSLINAEEIFVENSYPVHRLLSRYVRQLNVTLKIGDHTLDPEQVFQPEALLPIIALDAARIWDDLSTRPTRQAPAEDSLMVDFEPAREGFFPLSAHPVDVKNDLSSTLRMLTYILAARRVLGLKEGETIELTPFLSAWRTIDWTESKLPQIPISDNFDPAFYRNEFRPKVVVEKKKRASPFASQRNKENAKD